MERFYGYKLGTYAGREYSLSVSGTPSINDVEEFAVTIHYYDIDADETVEIARIDTAHGVTHFDKLFRRDQPKEELDIDYLEAETRLRENWRRYARSYERTHGD
jgi:hypothetical protein